MRNGNWLTLLRVSPCIGLSLAAGILLAGCAARHPATGPQAAPGAEQPPPAFDPGLLPLDSPAELTRQAAGDSIDGLFRFGADFDLGLSAQRVEWQRSTLRMVPYYSRDLDAPPPVPAYAMYSFDLSARDCEPRLQVKLQFNEGEFYVLLPNYARDAWDSFPLPESGILQVPSFEPYLRDDRRLIVTLLDFPHERIVDWLRIGANPWQFTTLEDSANFYDYASLQFDTQDRPWMTYTTVWADDDSSGVAHADAGALMNDEVFNVPSFGMVLVLDNAGEPRLAGVQLAGRYEIRYAWKDAGTWHSELVATVPYSHTTSQGGSEPTAYTYMPGLDLRLDSGGAPCLAYYDSAIQAVYYARRVGAAWTVEQVEALQDVKTRSPICLKLDDEDVPHLAYGADWRHYLHYATKPGSTWEVYANHDAEVAGPFVTMVLDQLNQPLIACSDLQGFLWTGGPAAGEWQGQSLTRWWGSDELELQSGNDSMQHLVFRQDHFQDIIYGRLENGQWSFEAALGFNTFANYWKLGEGFMGLDSAGRPNILISRDDPSGYRLYLVTREE